MVKYFISIFFNSLYKFDFFNKKVEKLFIFFVMKFYEGFLKDVKELIDKIEIVE